MLILLANGCAKNNSETTHRVVVIHSYEPECEYYPDFNNKIAACFKKQGVNVEIRTFYLNCEQLATQEELDYMSLCLDSISSNPPDLILVNEDQATYSLLASKHPLVRQIPIVFSGVNYPNWPLLQQYSNVTGFWDKPDYLHTCKMIEDLFGKMNIRYFRDSTYIGRQVTNELRKQLSGSKYVFTELTGKMNRMAYVDRVQMPDTTHVIGVLLRSSPGAEVLWAINGMDKYNAFLFATRDFTTKRLGKFIKNQCFTVINENFGYEQGMLGGYITTLDIQVKESVQRGIEILKGKTADQLPILQSKKKYILDWSEMLHCNLSVDQLPAEYEVANMPFEVAHRKMIIFFSIVISLIIIVLIIFLLFLYIQELKRKHAVQLNLKREKEFLSLALEGGNIYVWKYDTEKSLFSFDPDFFIALNIPVQPISKDQFIEVLHPDDLKKVEKLFLSLIAGNNQKATIQFRCKFDQKNYIWWELRISYVDILKKDAMLSGLCLNIQAYKNREEELRQALDLAAKAELKQSFLANMSHEIRTPLNAIVGFSNLLANEEILEKEDKTLYINTINTNCDLLLKLINDILELSRIESGTMSFTYELCDLSELIQQIYHTQQMLVPRNIEFQKEIPSCPIVIKTDKLRLTQVITNFINNAVKFTPAGFIRVGYKKYETRKCIVIYVEDSGIGIAEQEQRMIFNRFYKQNEFAQGTGLGLSICQVIIDKLGGTISLESEIGKGSCFTISLPYTEEFLDHLDNA